jgi:nitroreductase
VTDHAFSTAERRAVYRAIAERRDMRRFVPGAVVPEDVLAELLGMPEDAEPVAILCLGPVPDFPDRPAPEIDRWAFGRPLDEFVSENAWPKSPALGLSSCQP